MAEDDFFVNVQDVPTLRKNLLASSKSSLESLKIHLRLREIHKEKLSLKKTLDSQLKELSLLFSEMYDLLPNHELLVKPKKSKHSTSSKKVTKKKLVSSRSLPRKQSSKVDMINKALEDIEKKLSTL